MKVTKDLYLYLTNFVDDKTILNMLSVNKKFNNPDFFEQVIRTKYPLVIEYKDETMTWRKFYVNLIFSIFMIKEKYNIEFNGKYNPIKFYKSWKELVEKHPKIKIDPSAQNNYVIRCLEEVKYLMSLPKEYGIDPSANNNLAIRWASLNGHLEVVKYLMSLPKEYTVH